MTLSLEVVSGQHIPRPQGADEGEVIDPYVEVNIIKGGHDQLSKYEVIDPYVEANSDKRRSIILIGGH